MLRDTLLAVVVALAVVQIAVGEEAADPHADPHAEVRGMTISCPGAGQIWGTDTMVETMERLRDLGVNWVCIHPYASIGADGSVGGRMERMYANPIWLTRPIQEAKRLGLKIMIKPHLAYWGSPFSWRGDITFETDAQWQRFFTTYEAWIARVAGLSRDADAFVVGTELGGTVQHETEWRKIIAGVRAETNVPLSYAANWDAYERVPFWDALDVIGIQGYFPLVNHDEQPTAKELETSWKRLVRRLERFADEKKRDVLLAELGYNRSAKAAAEPWDYHQGGPNAELVQERCLDAALAALAESDRVVGAFLWKWFPGERNRGNFLKSTPAMQRVIARHWKPAAAASSGRPAS